MRSTLCLPKISVVADVFRNVTLRRGARLTAVLVSLGVVVSVGAFAQGNSLVLNRDGRTIVLEAYAPNIVRVTMSKTEAMATTAPGYGFVGTASMTGWTHEKEPDGS